MDATDAFEYAASHGARGDRTSLHETEAKLRDFTAAKTESQLRLQQDRLRAEQRKERRQFEADKENMTEYERKKAEYLLQQREQKQRSEERLAQLERGSGGGRVLANRASNDTLTEFERSKQEFLERQARKKAEEVARQEEVAFKKQVFARELLAEEDRARRDLDAVEREREERGRERKLRKQQAALAKFEEEQRLKRMSADERAAYMAGRRASSQFDDDDDLFDRGVDETAAEREARLAALEQRDRRLRDGKLSFGDRYGTDQLDFAPSAVTRNPRFERQDELRRVSMDRKVRFSQDLETETQSMAAATPRRRSIVSESHEENFDGDFARPRGSQLITSEEEDGAQANLVFRRASNEIRASPREIMRDVSPREIVREVPALPEKVVYHNNRPVGYVDADDDVDMPNSRRNYNNYASSSSRRSLENQNKVIVNPYADELERATSHRRSTSASRISFPEVPRVSREYEAEEEYEEIRAEAAARLSKKEQERMRRDRERDRDRELRRQNSYSQRYGPPQPHGARHIQLNGPPPPPGTRPVHPQYMMPVPPYPPKQGGGLLARLGLKKNKKPMVVVPAPPPPPPHMTPKRGEQVYYIPSQPPREQVVYVDRPKMVPVVPPPPKQAAQYTYNADAVPPPPPTKEQPRPHRYVDPRKVSMDRQPRYPPPMTEFTSDVYKTTPDRRAPPPPPQVPMPAPAPTEFDSRVYKKPQPQRRASQHRYIDENGRFTDDKMRLAANAQRFPETNARYVRDTDQYSEHDYTEEVTERVVPDADPREHTKRTEHRFAADKSPMSPGSSKTRGTPELPAYRDYRYVETRTFYPDKEYVRYRPINVDYTVVDSSEFSRRKSADLYRSRSARGYESITRSREYAAAAAKNKTHARRFSETDSDLYSATGAAAPAAVQRSGSRRAADMYPQKSSPYSYDVYVARPRDQRLGAAAPAQYNMQSPASSYRPAGDRRASEELKNNRAIYENSSRKSGEFYTSMPVNGKPSEYSRFDTTTRKSIDMRQSVSSEDTLKRSYGQDYAATITPRKSGEHNRYGDYGARTGDKVLDFNGYGVNPPRGSSSAAYREFDDSLDGSLAGGPGEPQLRRKSESAARYNPDAAYLDKNYRKSHDLVPLRRGTGGYPYGEDNELFEVDPAGNGKPGRRFLDPEHSYDGPRYSVDGPDVRVTDPKMKHAAKKTKSPSMRMGMDAKSPSFFKRMFSGVDEMNRPLRYPF